LYELLLLQHDTFLGVLPDGAVGYVKQSLRNIKCCANVTAVQFSQGSQTNTVVPLEVFAFAAFGLLRTRTVWPNSNPMAGLPLVFPFS
jgi:hypothetical protein